MTKLNIVKGSPVDEGAVKQMEVCLDDSFAVKGALCADHHLGYSMPIGGVVGYFPSYISPSGVGFDIGCGNKAILTDLMKDDIFSEMPLIMDQIYSDIEFGMSARLSQSEMQKRAFKIEHPLFELSAWKDVGFFEDSTYHLKNLAKVQFGSVGSGNHYVDIFYDELDRVWIGVHFGSRGFGHKVCTGFMNISKDKNFFDKPGGEDMNARATVLSLETYAGQSYYESMKLAGSYAYAGRDKVCKVVLGILGAKEMESVHNHHNFAWHENHDLGKYKTDLMVVRKGTTPAFPGQKCFIGGSMGDISVIAEGIESEESRLLLHSTVHGAGRAMSRSKAAGKRMWKKGKMIRKTEGLISQEDMIEYLKKYNVVLRGADVDEAPQAYKRIEEVLAQHEDSLKVLHQLIPMGVAMASNR